MHRSRGDSQHLLCARLWAQPAREETDHTPALGGSEPGADGQKASGQKAV